MLLAPISRAESTQLQLSELDSIPARPLATEFFTKELVYIGKLHQFNLRCEFNLSY